MKKLIYGFLIASMLFGGGVAFAYDDGTVINTKEESGGYASDPVRVYQLVRYPETSAGDSNINNALSTGDVVVWDCVSDDGVTVNVLLASNSQDAVAGVVVSANISTDQIATSASEDVGRRNWGYIQTYGFNDTVKVGDATLAGQALEVGTGNLARWAVASNQNTGSGVQFAFAYDVETKNTSADVFIRNR